MEVEVARLAPDQVAIEHQGAYRIGLGEALRLIEALAHPGRSEAILNLARGPLEDEWQEQLPAIRFEDEFTIAHKNAAVVILQIKRSHRAMRIKITPDAVEASAKGIEMPPVRQQLLRHPHQQKI